MRAASVPPAPSGAEDDVLQRNSTRYRWTTVHWGDEHLFIYLCSCTSRLASNGWLCVTSSSHCLCLGNSAPAAHLARGVLMQAGVVGDQLHGGVPQVLAGKLARALDQRQHAVHVPGQVRGRSAPPAPPSSAPAPHACQTPPPAWRQQCHHFIYSSHAAFPCSLVYSVSTFALHESWHQCSMHSTSSVCKQMSTKNQCNPTMLRPQARVDSTQLPPRYTPIRNQLHGAHRTLAIIHRR